MYCQKCGNEIPDNSVFCDVCGEKVFSQQETPKSPKKKRSNAVIVLSAFLAVALTGCGVLGYIVAKQTSEIASRDMTIHNYQDRLDDYRPKANFLDYYVVIVGNNGTKTYHKYGCVLLDTTNGYWAFNPEAARDNGYKPCSICCK